MFYVVRTVPSGTKPRIEAEATECYPASYLDVLEKAHLFYCLDRDGKKVMGCGPRCLDPFLQLFPAFP